MDQINYEPWSLIEFFQFTKPTGFQNQIKKKTSGFRRTLRTISFASGDALFQQSTRLAPQLTKQRATSGYPKRHASTNGWCSWPPPVVCDFCLRHSGKIGKLHNLNKQKKTEPKLILTFIESGQSGGESKSSESYPCLDDDSDLESNGQNSFKGWLLGSWWPPCFSLERSYWPDSGTIFEMFKLKVALLGCPRKFRIEG